MGTSQISTKLFRLIALALTFSLQANFIIGGPQESPRAKSRGASALSLYAHDLTKMAAEGKLPPADEYGREVERAVKILTGTNRRNLVLIGDEKAAQNSVVESLARQIAFGEAPEGLIGKKIYSLDLNLLFAGAKNRAEVDRRFRAALAEAESAAGRVILFIDEIDALGDGVADPDSRAPKALRAALARNNFACLAATTPAAYGERVRESGSLYELFQPLRFAESETARGEERENAKWEFKGDKMSPDLRELTQGADRDGGKLKVILQTSDLDNPEVVAALRHEGVRVDSRMPQLNSLEVELPSGALERLAEHDAVKYMSADREISSLGHIETTTGAAAVRKGVLGSAPLDGAGIGIAIIDSGVWKDHHSFSGRIVKSVDFTTENNPGGDAYGHGTHVASLAAASDHVATGAYTGIALKANLINLKVLNARGTGRVSDLLNALNWILAPVDPTKPLDAKNPSNKDKYNIRVVNLSLGTPAIDSYQNDPLCRAVRRLVDAGVVVVAAAGNDGKDAAGRKIYGAVHSPANEPSAITVGATNTFGTDARGDDAVATYSSRGPTRSYYVDAQGVKHYDNLLKPELVAPGNRLMAAESNNNTIVTTNPDLNVPDISTLR